MDRFGKRYKNVQSVFSINDDSQGSEDELNLSDIEPYIKTVEKVIFFMLINFLNYILAEMERSYQKTGDYKTFSMS